METTIIRLAGLVFALSLMLIVLRFRKQSIKETLALNKPKLIDILLFVGIWIVWLAISEFVFYKLNVLETGQWKNFTTAHVVVRGLSICIVAPIVEELIFRGLLFTRFKSRFGLKGAIFIPATLFALIHFKIDEGSLSNVWMLMIFIDAVYYGYVRYKSNSIIITILLHALGNSVALIERLW